MEVATAREAEIGSSMIRTAIDTLANVHGIAADPHSVRGGLIGAGLIASSGKVITIGAKTPGA